MQGIVTILFCVLIYFIIGYQTVAGKFGIFLVTAFLVEFISETIGCVGAIVTKTATVGILVSTSILMVGPVFTNQAKRSCSMHLLLMTHTHIPLLFHCCLAQPPPSPKAFNWGVAVFATPLRECLLPSFL